jgi:hypothetical protein
MAVVIADGYSFGPLLPGFSTTDYNEVISSGPYLSGFSDSSDIDNKLMMWQSPYFINQNCPTVGPARPTAGQVYPRGYN